MQTFFKRGSNLCRFKGNNALQNRFRARWFGTADNEYSDEENCLYLELDNNKHILVMGVFHHSYASTLIVQNAINTLKPDTVFLELCPWRGLKLEKIQHAYCKAYHYSPRDVESAAIFSATKQNSEIIFGDVPEQLIKAELKKYDENIFNILSHSQISMNEFEFYNYNMESIANKTTNTNKDIFIHNDNNGKQYILDENGTKCFIDAREGVRELMKINDTYLNDDIKRILYDDREKYMIKAMVEAYSTNTTDTTNKNMIAIIGMAHLDGIEKYWNDEAFWQDKEFWQLKYPKPTKREVKHYNRLLHTWFRDNFTRVPRFVPKFLKMGGD